MTRTITHRIATLGLAAIAVTAVGGTVSSASDEATNCQTWRPRIIVNDRYQHTWQPDDAIGERYQHRLNPDDAVDERYQHTLNAGDAIDARNQHTLNAGDEVDGRYQHTWNPASDRSTACSSPSAGTP